MIVAISRGRQLGAASKPRLSGKYRGVVHGPDPLIVGSSAHVIGRNEHIVGRALTMEGKERKRKRN